MFIVRRKSLKNLGHYYYDSYPTFNDALNSLKRLVLRDGVDSEPRLFKIPIKIFTSTRYTDEEKTEFGTRILISYKVIATKYKGQ